MSRLLIYIFVIINVTIIQGEGGMKEITLRYKEKNPEEVDLSYLLYLPNDYQQNKQDYPLVLFLHGAGERGTNLEKVKIQKDQNQNYKLQTHSIHLYFLN